MYRVVKPAKTSSAATPVAQSVRTLAVRTAVEAGGWPGDHRARVILFWCDTAKEARLPVPSPHRWVVVERRRPRSIQACMVSGVSERRDRAHLSCATIPIVTPGSYRRGRLLLWVFGVDDLPAVFPSTSSSSTCSRLGSGFPWFLRFLWPRSRFLLASSWFVVLLLVSAGSVGNPCGFRGSAPPFSWSSWRSSLWWITPAFYPYFWTSRRACILAVFTAFPSCEVPARWRDLPNVVLDILGK